MSFLKKREWLNQFHIIGINENWFVNTSKTDFFIEQHKECNIFRHINVALEIETNNQ